MANALRGPDLEPAPYAANPPYYLELPLRRGYCKWPKRPKRPKGRSRCGAPSHRCGQQVDPLDWPRSLRSNRCTSPVRAADRADAARSDLRRRETHHAPGVESADLGWACLQGAAGCRPTKAQFGGRKSP